VHLPRTVRVLARRLAQRGLPEGSRSHLGQCSSEDLHEIIEVLHLSGLIRRSLNAVLDGHIVIPGLLSRHSFTVLGSEASVSR